MDTRDPGLQPRVHPAAGADGGAGGRRAGRRDHLGSPGRNGLQVAPQRTGHNAEPLGAMDDVILVRTDRLQGVEIDVEPTGRPRGQRLEVGRRRATCVRSRSRGAPRVHPGRERRRLLARRRRRLVRAEARPVDEQRHGDRARHGATGSLRRVDLDNEPELFWALRVAEAASGS